MDFQETKKETKSERERKKKKKTREGGNEQNKAIEISSLASGLV